MDEAVMLIAAYAEEDRRLMELVDAFPVSARDHRGSDDQLSLKQTLGHIAFWDDYATRFYDTRCHHGAPEVLSPAEFEERNRQVLELLCNDPHEDVFTSYREATRMIAAFLREHWLDLDEASRENFKIPLKHRRHHRRRLRETLDDLGPNTPINDTLEERAS